VEASALPAPAGLAPSISLGLPLRMRSDEQLVALFRAGNEDAFRVIHDRYRQRLFAYTRQMLPGSRLDAEDALQDVFVRAYFSLRADRRELALRAWLYRVAHNRCVDQLRRPIPAPPEALEPLRTPLSDPLAAAEQRETLRRLVEDVRRLPRQQRSALLMRELSGMSYAELAGALGTSVPAVKSLLVRARIGLARAAQARDTACSEIHDELADAHDRGVRPSGNARRHLRDCAGCRQFRRELRGVSRQLGALAPIGPAAALAKLLGLGGGAGAASGAAASSTAGTGLFAGAGLIAGGATHAATLLAAAVLAAGGAVELQRALPASAQRATPSAAARHRQAAPRAGSIATAGEGAAGAASTFTALDAAAATPPGDQPGSPATAAGGGSRAATAPAGAAGTRGGEVAMTMDAGAQQSAGGGASSPSGTGTSSGSLSATVTAPGATAATSTPTGASADGSTPGSTSASAGSGGSGAPAATDGTSSSEAPSGSSPAGATSSAGTGSGSGASSTSASSSAGGGSPSGG
jgi:RNA polymerase sigma factor (sigma-70 family)